MNQKVKSKFWKTVHIIGFSIITLAGILIIIAVYRSLHWENTMAISPKLGYYSSYKGGYIYKLATDEIVIHSVDGVVDPRDSIAIFHRNGKRGYFNINNGKVIVEPIYEAAWQFQNGVAAVAFNDSVSFIGTDGKPLNGAKFKRIIGEDYLFDCDYCRIKVADKYGMIDKSGEWVLTPQWDYIEITPYKIVTAWSNGISYSGYFKYDMPQSPANIEIKGDTIYSASDSLRIYIKQSTHPIE